MTAIKPTPNKPTLYQGYYIDVRDGVRCGVTFTYNNENEGIFNETEVSVVKLD